MLKPTVPPSPDLAPASAALRKKVAVLISGRGSNLAALIAASMHGDYPAIVQKVISDKTDAGGLETAQSNNIATAVFERKSYTSDELHEAAIIEELENDSPDFICLAGFMRILSEDFVKRFSGRILNIHPSLLPAFRGLDTHHRALANGVRIHGCSVHIVTPTLDDGPILAQAAVQVLPSDTEESLAARVLKAEHALYPKALAEFAKGNMRFSGIKVMFSGEADRKAADPYLSSL